MYKSVDVMLVHGAWADASCWRKVILLLQAQGYEVAVVQIPFTSLDDDVAVTRMRLAGRPRPTTAAGGPPAWKQIPSWYLVCTDDRMIPPAAQQFMATRMHATVASIASSHAPFMSRPEDVARLIMDAAESVVTDAGSHDQLAAA